MKERPILFSGPMVRAILDGRKTQTRRPVRPQPPHSCRYEINGARTHALCLSGPPEALVFVPPLPKSENHRLPCPFGERGDRLWVRETWYCDHWEHKTAGSPAEIAEWREALDYRATHDCTTYDAGCPCNPDGDGKRSEWKPSIHMPRWASRILLEITEVRVQRLQSISEEDARQEGVGLVLADDFAPDQREALTQALKRSRRDGFAWLWDTLNSERAPWASDPWVWALTFQLVEESAGGSPVR